MTKKTSGALAALPLILAAMTIPVAARGPAGPGFPGEAPGPRGFGSSAVLDQLIYPCRNACFDAAPDPSTDDCRTARDALRTCAQACLTARNDAAGSCRTTGDGCLDACAQ
jgi:hypothetical protein